MGSNLNSLTKNIFPQNILGSPIGPMYGRIINMFSLIQRIDIISPLIAPTPIEVPKDQDDMLKRIVPSPRDMVIKYMSGMSAISSREIIIMYIPNLEFLAGGKNKFNMHDPTRDVEEGSDFKSKIFKRSGKNDQNAALTPITTGGEKELKSRKAGI